MDTIYTIGRDQTPCIIIRRYTTTATIRVLDGARGKVMRGVPLAWLTDTALGTELERSYDVTLRDGNVITHCSPDCVRS